MTSSASPPSGTMPTPDGGIMCGDAGCVHITPEAAKALWDAAKAQEAERTARYPDEASAIRAMFDGFTRLQQLGWRQAMYAPEGVELDVIEPGSTGVHFATRDAERRFWIHDTDTWPSTPCLFRLRATPAGHEP